MKYNSLKTELEKALNNRGFFAALAIGLLLSAVNIGENLALIAEMGEHRGRMSASLFCYWLGITPGTAKGVFYTIWPLLAALPYGWSYIQERTSGVHDQIVCRVGRKKYFFAKYLAVFVSGGLVLMAPLLFDLLANALVCTYWVPNVTYYLTLVFDGHFLSTLYYTQPWLYALLWCGMTFLWGGAAACLCLTVGTWPKLRSVVTILPFIVLMAVDGVIAVLPAYAKGKLELSPMLLVRCAPPHMNPGWLEFLALSVLTIFSLALGYWQVVKHELA